MIQKFVFRYIEMWQVINYIWSDVQIFALGSLYNLLMHLYLLVIGQDRLKQ